MIQAGLFPSAPAMKPILTAGGLMIQAGLFPNAPAMKPILTAGGLMIQAGRFLSQSAGSRRNKEN